MNREQRRAAAKHGPKANIATCMAWAADDDTVEEAKRYTHDAVIGVAGAHRSAVQWRIWQGEQARAVLAHESLQPVDEEILRGMTDFPDGLLVVAMCEHHR